MSFTAFFPSRPASGLGPLTAFPYHVSLSLLKSGTVPQPLVFYDTFEEYRQVVLQNSPQCGFPRLFRIGFRLYALGWLCPSQGVTSVGTGVPLPLVGDVGLGHLVKVFSDFSAV